MSTDIIPVHLISAFTAESQALIIPVHLISAFTAESQALEFSEA